MTDLIDRGELERLNSSFLKDILAGPEAVNSYNSVYNLDPVILPENVLVSKMRPVVGREISRQTIEDISIEMVDLINSVVVKDTFPISRGHVLCVPLAYTPSYNRYLATFHKSVEQFQEMAHNLTRYLIRQSNNAGFACKQVVFFEHGSGILDSSPLVYNACGTGIELCSTAVHAHLHAVPILDNVISIEQILQVLEDLLGNHALDIFNVLSHEDHSKMDLGNGSYFSFRIINDHGQAEFILIRPSMQQFSQIPSQLWRRVLGLVLPKLGEIDLVDYKKLAKHTVGELRSERTVSLLRTLHDSFWTPKES